MRQMIGAVGDMGSGTIRGTVHSCWPATLPGGHQDRRPFRDQRLRGMREMVRPAEDRGVRLLVEVIDRFGQLLLTTSAEAVERVSDVGSPACRMQLDTFPDHPVRGAGAWSPGPGRPSPGRWFRGDVLAEVRSACQRRGDFRGC